MNVSDELEADYTAACADLDEAYADACELYDSLMSVAEADFAAARAKSKLDELAAYVAAVDVFDAARDAAYLAARAVLIAHTDAEQNKGETK